MVAVGGWRGVGTTTAALALAAAWGQRANDVVLVEADPAGGVLAGRIAAPSERVGGLESLAFPLHGSSVEIDDVAVPLGDTRVVLGSADPFRAAACHRPRHSWLTTLAERPGMSVIDVGRLHGARPTGAVLERCERVVVVMSPEVASAVSTVEWVRSGGRVSTHDAEVTASAIRLLVVEQPTGVAFGRRALMSELGALLVGWLPWDLATVDLLHRGASLNDRRVRRTEFAAAARAAVASIEERA